MNHCRDITFCAVFERCHVQLVQLFVIRDVLLEVPTFADAMLMVLCCPGLCAFGIEFIRNLFIEHGSSV